MWIYWAKEKQNHESDGLAMPCAIFVSFEPETLFEGDRRYLYVHLPLPSSWLSITKDTMPVNFIPSVWAFICHKFLPSWQTVYIVSSNRRADTI